LPQPKSNIEKYIYSNIIREADIDYNIPQTTRRRYIIDTKKQKP